MEDILETVVCDTVINDAILFNNSCCMYPCASRKLVILDKIIPNINMLKLII